jgi:hypothetical protein
MMPGNRAVAPATTQSITVDGANGTTNNPYSFSALPIGTHKVEAILPGTNYAVGYTTCVAPDTCSTDTPTLGSSATINCTGDETINLWWHYYEIAGWYKLSNTSLHKQNSIFNYFPDPVEKFDNDDTTDAFLVVKNGGLVTAGGAIDFGPHPGQVTARDWERSGYVKQVNYLDNLSSFIGYVRARKKFNSITDLDGMKSNAIQVVAGNITIDNPSQFNVDNAVLLVDGDITIGPMPGNKLNASGKSIAIIATGTIYIHSSVTDIHAILIANAVDIASDLASPSTSTNELKITGNLISNTAINGPLKRERTNHLQPSLFVVFDPQMYLDLIPYLSTIIREGREIQ